MAKKKRYTIDVPTAYTPEAVNEIVNQFAHVEGFEFVNYKGENVLKKGKGLMAAPQFIKVDITPGSVHIEAWLKSALLPGVYVGEMGLDGVMGFAIKDMLRGRVNRLVASITQANGVQVNAPQQPPAQPTA